MIAGGYVSSLRERRREREREEKIQVFVLCRVSKKEKKDHKAWIGFLRRIKRRKTRFSFGYLSHTLDINWKWNCC